MSDGCGCSALAGARVVRIDPPPDPYPFIRAASGDALVVGGGFCAPGELPLYGWVELDLRFRTPDDWAWDGVDFDRLVAPRLTELQRTLDDLLRRIRWAARVAWRILRTGYAREADW